MWGCFESGVVNWSESMDRCRLGVLNVRCDVMRCLIYMCFMCVSLCIDEPSGVQIQCTSVQSRFDVCSIGVVFCIGLFCLVLILS